MKHTSRIVTHGVGPASLRVTTPIHGRPIDVAWKQHSQTVTAQGGGGTDPCLETEIDCNGSLLLIETCCQPGETIEQCAARHEHDVERAEQACGS